MNKLTDLKFELENRKPSVICITETWLNHEISNAIFPCIDMYDIFHSDRRNGRGGGVLILVRKCLSGSLFLSSNDSLFFEGVWVDLYCNKNRLRVGTIYRKPVDDNSMPFSLINHIDSALRNSPPAVLVGDFNYGDIDFEQYTAPKVSGQHEFLMYTIQRGLVQFIDKPTCEE